MNAKRNDNDYTKQLVEFQPNLFHFVSSLLPGFASDVADVVNGTNQELIEKQDAFRQNGRDDAFSAWAIGFAKRKVREFLAKRKRQKLCFLGDAFALAEQEAARLATETPDRSTPLLKRLQVCREHLPQRDRDLLSLYYDAQLPLAEIARLHRKTPHAIANALCAARKKLSTCIRRLCNVPDAIFEQLHPELHTNAFEDKLADAVCGNAAPSSLYDGDAEHLSEILIQFGMDGILRQWREAVSTKSASFSLWRKLAASIAVCGCLVFAYGAYLHLPKNPSEVGSKHSISPETAVDRQPETKEQNMNMKQLSAAVVLTASAACADVFSDALAFFRAGQSEGKLELSNYHDVRNWDNWTGLKPSSFAGPFGAPLYTNMTVYMPSRGVSVAQDCLWFPPYTQTSGNWNWPSTMDFAPSTGHNIKGDTASFVARIYLVPSVHLNRAILFNAGLNWGSNQGWEFGFYNFKSSDTKIYPYIELGQKLGQWRVTDLSVFDAKTPGWYDVGVSVLENGDEDRLIIAVGTPSRGFEYAVTTGALIAPRPDIGTLRIGDEGAWTSAPSNARLSFHGTISQYAIWNRALDVTELAEAMGYPSEVFCVGIENNSSTEFGATDARSGDAEDLWKNLPGGVSASTPDYSLYFNITNDQQKLPFVFRMKSAGVSGTSSAIDLSFNGKTIASPRIAANSERCFFVPSNTLASGANTLRIRHRAGDELAIDKMELAGSWLVGKRDRSAEEFSSQYDVGNEFLVGNRNFKNASKALFGRGGYASSNIVFRFYVPETIARKYSFHYESRVQQPGQNAAETSTAFTSGRYPFDIQLNGRTFFSATTPNGPVEISHDFDANELRAGWNEIRYRVLTGDFWCWILLDFHELRVKNIPQGTVVQLI